MKWLENIVVKLSNHVDKKLDGLIETKAYIATHDAYMAGDFKTALPGYEKLAHDGNGRAASMAGGMHLEGKGTTKSISKALMYLEMGRDVGDHDSIALLGMLYASGMDGVKVDLKKARPLLEVAAKKGDVKAEKMLTLMNEREAKQGKGRGK